MDIYVHYLGLIKIPQILRTYFCIYYLNSVFYLQIFSVSIQRKSVFDFITTELTQNLDANRLLLLFPDLEL